MSEPSSRKIINVTDTYNRLAYVEIISSNLLLLDRIQPVMNTRGDMVGKLRTMLEYIRDHASLYIYGKNYTGVSIRKLSEIGGGSWTTWEKYIHMWIEWGLMGRPDHSISENNRFEVNAMLRAERETERTGHRQNATTMYTVTRWTAEQLAGLQRISGAGTKASTIHRRGQAAADDIWGDRRKISRVQQRAEMKIRETISKEISEHGYCKRDTLRGIRVYFTSSDGKRKRVKMDPVFDAMRPEIEQLYQYGRPTAEIREQLREIYGAEISGREWIITARSNAPDAPPQAREAR